MTSYIAILILVCIGLCVEMWRMRRRYEQRLDDEVKWGNDRVRRREESLDEWKAQERSAIAQDLLSIATLPKHARIRAALLKYADVVTGKAQTL